MRRVILKMIVHAAMRVECQHYPSERPILAGRRIEGDNHMARAKLSLTCVGTPNTFNFALPNAC